MGEDIRDHIVVSALNCSELSPREFALRFADEKRHFVSKVTVYRALNAHDLITSPAFLVIKAAHKFQTKKSYQSGARLPWPEFDRWTGPR